MSLYVLVLIFNVLCCSDKVDGDFFDDELGDLFRKSCNVVDCKEEEAHSNVFSQRPVPWVSHNVSDSSNSMDTIKRAFSSTTKSSFDYDYESLGIQLCNHVKRYKNNLIDTNSNFDQIDQNFKQIEAAIQDLEKKAEEGRKKYRDLMLRCGRQEIEMEYVRPRLDKVEKMVEKLYEEIGKIKRGQRRDNNENDAENSKPRRSKKNNR